MVVLGNIQHPITNSKIFGQNTKKLTTAINHNSLTPKPAPVFVLCERCYWCATYLDTNRLSKGEGVDEDNNKVCPRCDAIDSLSRLPILSNESFNFNHTDKQGVLSTFILVKTKVPSIFLQEMVRSVL